MRNKILRDDFLKNHILTNLKINRNQNIAAFIVNKANLEKNQYDKNLWIIHLENQNIKKLCISNNIIDFVWKDGYLIYLVNRDNENVFYKYDFNTDESLELLSVPMNISRFFFVKDKLFFISTVSSISKTDKVLEGTEIPFYDEAMGVFSGYRKRLCVCDLKSKNIEIITKEKLHIGDISINEEQNKVAFIAYEIEGYRKTKSSIYLLDLRANVNEQISSKDALKISYVDFLDSDTVIFLGADLKIAGRNENHEFYLIDLTTKKQTQLTKGFDKSTIKKAVVTDARFCKSRDVCIYKNELYFLTIEEKGSYLYKINKHGIITKLSSESGTIDSYTVLDDAILLIGMRGYGLQEIYYLKNNKESKLTDFNDWLLKNRTIGKPAYMCVEKGDGTLLDGWVIKPIDYCEGKKYPGVLNIHGGPKMVFTHVYVHEMQILASQGYFVFFCNPRGSDGKGNGFADIRGNFSSYAYEDLMYFTDKVLEKYQDINEDKLGVMGGSYGGYMTNYIIGHTTRFKAAVSERGISNLISTFTTSDIGYQYIFNYMGGTENPWDDIKLFLEESPLVYADRVKTPTLFIHGKNDYRCNYTESLQMYTAIRYFGVDSKICVFEGENHSLPRGGKPLNKIKRYDEIVRWFNTYIN